MPRPSRRAIPSPVPRAGLCLRAFLRRHRGTALLCGGLLAAGCRSNCDLVEAELRAREEQVYHLKGELCRSQSYNEALQREVHDLHQCGPVAVGPPGLPSEVYTVKQVVLGRLTGGYNGDDIPGDEALQVVLEPLDPDGSAIKAPGSLHVTAFEVNEQGLKRPISSWEISPDQLRRSWRCGIFLTGYQLILPWQSWPSCERIRVLAQFTLADGRLFEADRDITIHLPPQVQPAPVPVPVPLPVEELPLPNKDSVVPTVPPPPVPAKDGKSETISLRPADILPPRPLPPASR